jgi:hypothetical protein
VDFGFFRKVALGNLVFYDVNNDGKAGASECISGVTLELYDAIATPGIDAPLATTVSGVGGRYLFDGHRAGAYVVHIPKSMFQPGAPLFTKVSIAEGFFGDDDVGEDGLNITDPVTEGVSTDYIFLSPGLAPTNDNGETGVDYTADDSIDAAVDLTVDFGFQNPVGVGNLVFIDANHNGRADVGEGVGNVIVEVYRSTETPASGLPLFRTTTTSDGHYLFTHLTGGSYFVHISSINFAPGAPLYDLFPATSVSAAALAELIDDKS